MAANCYVCGVLMLDVYGKHNICARCEARYEEQDVQKEQKERRKFKEWVEGKRNAVTK